MANFNNILQLLSVKVHFASPFWLQSKCWSMKRWLCSKTQKMEKKSSLPLIKTQVKGKLSSCLSDPLSKASKSHSKVCANTSGNMTTALKSELLWCTTNILKDSVWTLNCNENSRQWVSDGWAWTIPETAGWQSITSKGLWIQLLTKQPEENRPIQWYSNIWLFYQRHRAKKRRMQRDAFQLE